MTTVDILWTLAAVCFAAALAVAGIEVLHAVHHRQRTAREPETERPLAWAWGWAWAAAVAATGFVLLRMVRLVVLYRRLASGRRQPAPATGITHEGATESFGGELRALRDAPLSPELVPVLTEAQHFAEVHDELDAVMADFRHDLDHILDGICRQLDPLWARVDFPTGEFALVPNDLALTGIQL